MNTRNLLHKARAAATSIPARVIGFAREAAPILSAGSISVANDQLWLGIGVVVIGVITIDNARDHAVERARYEAFKEGILSLLNNNGANIKVTYHDGGATISIPKGDAK